MKKVKVLIIAALTICVGIPAMAQDDEATIKQITEVIKSKSADAPAQVKAVYKKNKKNAAVVTGIGKAYFEIGDTSNAKVYAEYGKTLKYSPAFVLAGDLAALNEDGGGAASEYQQAIYFDKTNEEAYYKYASVYSKTDPKGAVEKLEELRAINPNAPVDALIGRIYFKKSMLPETITSYGKVSRSKLERRDLVDYIMAYYLSQKYEEGLELAQYGMTQHPRHGGITRLAFFNAVESKQYETALKLANELFTNTDSLKITYLDYPYYGMAYVGLEKYPEAIDAFKKGLEQEFDSKEKKAGVMKQLSDVYKQADDYDNAEKEYGEFIDFVDTPTPEDYSGYANLYELHAAATEDAEAKYTIAKKAEAIYDLMEEKFPSTIDFTTYKKAMLNVRLDPNSTEGLAKPYFEKLIELIEPKEEKDAADNSRLLRSYQYLGAYYFIVADDKENADVYWSKVLEVDPENEQAKQVMAILHPEQQAQ